jgi:hypothetical protein
MNLWSSHNVIYPRYPSTLSEETDQVRRSVAFGSFVVLRGLKEDEGPKDHTKLLQSKLLTTSRKLKPFDPLCRGVPRVSSSQPSYGTLCPKPRDPQPRDPQPQDPQPRDPQPQDPQPRDPQRRDPQPRLLGQYKSRRGLVKGRRAGESLRLGEARWFLDFSHVLCTMKRHHYSAHTYQKMCIVVNF